MTFVLKMERINMEQTDFTRMIEGIVEQIVKKYNAPLDRWIDGEECMRLLRISSTTTLQKLRDQQAITFSQPMKKVILYDRLSVEAYLEKHKIKAL